jgi:hypothetical protein
MRFRMLRAVLLFSSCGCISLAADQPSPNVLQEMFAIQPLDKSPLLSAQFPSLSLLLVNRRVEVQVRRGAAETVLRAPGSETTLVARFMREAHLTFAGSRMVKIFKRIGNKGMP